MAREVDNLDDEIVSQIGGGGVESDSECELITVLAFHHGGLLKEFGAAQKTISNEWEERWTTKPTRHLPFVPCRLLPRNVVLQERLRLVEGKVDPLNNPVTETYWKARVSLHWTAAMEAPTRSTPQCRAHRARWPSHASNG